MGFNSKTKNFSSNFFWVNCAYLVLQIYRCTVSVIQKNLEFKLKIINSTIWNRNFSSLQLLTEDVLVSLVFMKRVPVLPTMIFHCTKHLQAPVNVFPISFNLNIRKHKKTAHKTTQFPFQKANYILLAVIPPLTIHNDSARPAVFFPMWWITLFHNTIVTCLTRTDESLTEAYWINLANTKNGNDIGTFEIAKLQRFQQVDRAGSME